MSPILASLLIFAASSPPVDTVRQSLSARSERMFFWLVVSSIVTGIGVIFEGPGELHELKRWWKLKKLGKNVGWRVPVTFFGLLLVIGGIIGEGIFEFLSADAETSIRQHDEQVLGDTIIKAGSAKESAEIAEKAAEAASMASGIAKDTAGKAKEAAESANTLATGARKEADSFEKDIKSAKVAAARAEEKLADRTLSDDQQKELAIKLARFAGQEYTVTAYWESPESLGLANRIHGALNDLAKWKYNPVGSKSMMMGGEVGIFVWRHPDADPDTKLAVSSLVSALQSDGLKSEERIQNPTNNPKNNLIGINVGSKR